MVALRGQVILVMPHGTENGPVVVAAQRVLVSYMGPWVLLELEMCVAMVGPLDALVTAGAHLGSSQKLRRPPELPWDNPSSPLPSDEEKPSGPGGG